MTSDTGTDSIRRLRWDISGLVQGVGFRPFVWRLARDTGVGGWIANTTDGVRIEVEGPSPSLDLLRRRLRTEAPPLATIRSWAEQELSCSGELVFIIAPSDALGSSTSSVLPDLAPCASCVADFMTAGDRREGYPFTNCTACGPRFSIVRSLPYDRARTTMAAFRLCGACGAEYGNPSDRRFHAQPTACPACGPAVALWDEGGAEIARGSSAMERAAVAIRDGKIVAVKGLGGFHLIVDAGSSSAVQRLRARKRREEKPFAVLVATLAEAHTLVRSHGDADALLNSPQAPIVLLPRRYGNSVAPEVAPSNPRLGVFLPPTPLHHLLMRSVGRPVVATSGNLSDEPICTDEREAVSRLSGIADRFLIHDRPIERHVDDSVAWWVDGAPALIRRARGYAPEPLWLRDELPPLLAVGAHLKNTIAVSSDRRVFVSQHVGDLETPEAMAAFERVILDFLEFYGIRPVAIVHDRHPDYGSTHWARNASASGILSGVRLLAVQHHHAHLSACLEENGARGPSLGVVWDGTGYGEDGTVWGGEFLMGDATGFRRVAHLLPFRLAGGEAAIKEPRRVAYALLREAFGGDLRGLETLPPVKVLEEREREVLDRLLDRGLLSPVTTSAGRLFDGIAALTGIRQFAAYEGQAAMELEWAAGDVEGDPYPFSILDEGLGEGLVLDWRPLVREVARNVLDGTNAAKISAGFHAAMANAIAEMASRLGVPRVALAGGCFQNRLLTEGAARKLRDRGLEVLLHRQLPPNDGSICLGQIAVAAAKLKQGD